MKRLRRFLFWKNFPAHTDPVNVQQSTSDGVPSRTVSLHVHQGTSNTPAGVLHEQPESSSSQSALPKSGTPPSTTSNSLLAPGPKPPTQEPFDVKSVRDIDGLEKLLDLIEKNILEHGSKTSSETTWPDFVNSNLNPSATLLGQLANACYPPGGTMRDIMTEAHIVLVDTLKELSNLHTAAAVLAIVASVVNRVNQIKENMEDSLNFLKDLSKLGRHTVNLLNIAGDLRKESSATEKNIVEACSLIAAGAALCFRHLQSKSWRRGILAGTYKRELAALKDASDRLSHHLNLFATVKTFKTVGEIHEAVVNSYPNRPKFPKQSVGLDEKIEIVLQMLGFTDAADVDLQAQAVLLHGMGGIGKSTLGQAICAKIHERKAHLWSFAKIELSSNASARIVELQQDIHKTLPALGNRKVITNCAQGQDVLEEQFKDCRTPILLFIDNVYKVEDLGCLFPDPLCLPANSIVIVTSRDLSVARMFKVDGKSCKHYDVPSLDRELAVGVLEHHLGEPLQTEWAERVLKECGDLPLFLEVIAKHVKRKGHTKEVWTAIDRRLREGHDLTGYKNSDDKIANVFALSYDEFSPHVQEAFLDICLLKSYDVDWVKTIVGDSDIQSLVDFSLVKETAAKSTLEDLHDKWTSGYHLRSIGRSTIHVHDLGVHFGRRKAKMTRLSLQEGQSIEDFERVEGLVMSSYKELSAETLDLMFKSLRILITPWGISGQCTKTPTQLQICSIAGSIGGGFPYKDVQSLQNLRVLDISFMDHCNLEEAQLPGQLEIFKICRVGFKTFHPKAFKQCRDSLHTVHIVSCSAMEDLSDGFCSLECLAVLVLAKNDKLKSLPATGFHRLKSLQSVFIDQSFEDLPRDFSKLPALRGLFLSKCTRLSMNFGELKGLEYLCVDLLEGGGFSDVISPPSFSKIGLLHQGMHDLQVVHARGVEQERLEADDFSNFTCLAKVIFERCESLEKLPRGFEDLPALQQLDLQRCKRLNELPTNFSRLKFLLRLDLSFCENLQELPQDFCELQFLVQLNLSHCYLLKELPQGFGDLLALQELDLRQCERLIALPASFSKLQSLLQLDLSHCYDLRELPESFSQLTSLEMLHLTECAALEKLPHGLGLLSAVHQWSLHGFASLRDLPKDYFQIPWVKDLKELNLSDCQSLQELPLGLGGLSALHSINLRRCERLQRLPEDVSLLTSLEVLNLKGCISLDELPRKFGSLMAMKDLNLSGCARLQELPEKFSTLTSLEKLNLKRCTGLAHLQKLGGPPSLKSLNMSGWGEVQKLPVDVSQLVFLQKMKLDEWICLRELPEGLEDLTDLSYLSIRSCESLRKLPEEFFALERLQVQGCMALQQLPRRYGSSSPVEVYYLGPEPFVTMEMKENSYYLVIFSCFVFLDVHGLRDWRSHPVP